MAFFRSKRASVHPSEQGLLLLAVLSFNLDIPNDKVQITTMAVATIYVCVYIHTYIYIYIYIDRHIEPVSRPTSSTPDHPSRCYTPHQPSTTPVPPSNLPRQSFTASLVNNPPPSHPSSHPVLHPSSHPVPPSSLSPLPERVWLG